MLSRGRICSLAALLTLPLVGACAAQHGGARTATIDGDLGEWRGGVVSISTPDAVYFRFSPGEVCNLQANDETTRLVFDLDNDPATGDRLDGPPDVGTLGVDMEILMSPPLTAIDPGAAQHIINRRIQRGQPASPYVGGLTVLTHVDGVTSRFKHAAAGFIASPTYAADMFEARLDRHAPGFRGTGLQRAGTARGIVLVTDAAGNVVRYSDPIEFELPEMGPARLARPALPDQPAGTIRVMSMNVLHGKPLVNPEPFARIIAAVKPDVILLQEADDMTDDSLKAWLNGYVGPLPGKQDWAEGVQGLAGEVGTWDAVADPDLGVAVATPHLVARRFGEPVTVTDPTSGRPRTSRAVFALVSTPNGDVLACSTHLKCCGSAGSREDLIRKAETAAINERFAAIASTLRQESGVDDEVRLIAGDMNLVGTRDPVDIIRRGLDTGGGDLIAVDTPVLAGDAWYTWRDDRNAFSPGRLDWVLVGDARPVQSFALDLRLIDPEVLTEWGLRPGDTGVSDHLPVVVDIRP